MDKIPEHIRAQLIAARLDTFQRDFGRTRAVELDPRIAELWGTLRTLTGEMIELYEKRIPVVPDAALPSTDNYLPEGYEGDGLSHRLVDDD